MIWCHKQYNAHFLWSSPYIRLQWDNRSYLSSISQYLVLDTAQEAVQCTLLLPEKIVSHRIGTKYESWENSITKKSLYKNYYY